MRIRKDTDILDKEEIDLIASCSDALAHPARVEIFRFVYRTNLNRSSVCNKDIVEEFDYAQATISQHISKLTGSGLLEIQKKGNRNYYFVSLGVLSRYLNAVKKLNE
ncbi:MAG: winged helix-turn-helix transcriptional regulator [Clostridiales bacterium]|nr:winged helix-turn-helix transcriptional regulator [Clostridiales bacterium]